MILDGVSAGADEIKVELACGPTIHIRKPTLEERMFDDNWSAAVYNGPDEFQSNVIGAIAVRDQHRLRVVTNWSGVQIRKIKDGETIEEDQPFTETAFKLALQQSKPFRQQVLAEVEKVFLDSRIDSSK